MKHDSDRKVIFIVEDNELYLMYLDYYLDRDNEFAVKSGKECFTTLECSPDSTIIDSYLKYVNRLDTHTAINRLKPNIPVAIYLGYWMKKSSDYCWQRMHFNLLKNTMILCKKLFFRLIDCMKTDNNKKILLHG